MNIADAPTTASGLTMVIVAIVMLLSLSAWLGLVFLADRPARVPRAKGRAAVWIEERVSEASERRGKTAA